jgi:predicted aldo/keto reductase-like oxidoreductase
LTKTHITRRDFLSKSTFGIAAYSIFNVNKKAPLAGKRQISGEIIKRNLGKTGIKLPIVSMGVMNADNPAVLIKAYEMGIRHFDTAWGYQEGRNEEMVGRVLKETGDRNNIILATKTELGYGNKSFFFLRDFEEFKASEGNNFEKKLKEEFLARFETSLKRLNQDYVDILYVHSPTDPKILDYQYIKDVLEQLKKEGKIRFTGVSVHRREAELIDKAVDLKIFDVVLVPVNFKRDIRDSILRSMKLARQKGVATVAMKTQAVWGGKNKETHHTAALKWVLQHEFIDTSIPGFTTFDQLEEDFSVTSNLQFTEEEEKYLKDYWENDMGADIPCQQCESCIDTCPGNTDIPELMRTYMYAAGYKNFEHSRINYESISERKNLSNCVDCKNCTAICCYGIDIKSNIRHLKAIYT